MFLLLLLTLGITIDLSESIPEECLIKGYKNLTGKSHEHRILHFKPSTSSGGMGRMHDRTNASKNLFEKYWFRFQILNGTRMLEIRDLDQQSFVRNETYTNVSTALFQRPYNVHNFHITLDER